MRINGAAGMYVDVDQKPDGRVAPTRRAARLDFYPLATLA